MVSWKHIKTIREENEMYSAKDFTLEEKIRFLNGVDMWHTFDADGKVPTLHLSDGPSGLRKIDENGKTVKSTLMPSISSVANTWSRECAYLDGATIADDCIDEDVDVLLAPGVNIKRTPVCGRNFEYFSEDPYLAGELAYHYINGVQDKGVGTSLKHYFANNSESDRLHKNSEIDERTMREIYLAQFERALQANPYTVMCSYNLINGVYASESKKYLNDYLRDKFGFDGLIVSDWGATRVPYRSALASLDLVMPRYENHFEKFMDAVEKGYISENEIDKCVERVLKLIEKCQNKKKVTTTKAQRHENAVKIAMEGIVLLKNKGALPLKKGKITVVGTMANTPKMNGGGSADGETDFIQKPLYELLEEKIPSANIDKSLIKIKTCGHIKFLGNAYEKAYNSDTVVICIGNDSGESEFYDRQIIKLSPEQEAFIVNMSKYNKNIVVALFAGSAVDMSAWIDSVNAVVLAGYSGEGINEALAAILSGEVSPSGKLSESYPMCLEDVNVDMNIGGTSVRYSEGVFVGYRYYDTYGVPVLFPFGHGLSYADFEYSNLEIKQISKTDFDVSYDITNTSDIDAAEVSQLYVKDVLCHVERPEKELKGFSKDFIRAHETKSVTHHLNYRSFAYYNVGLDDWHVENGDFEIKIGASVSDIRLNGKICINLAENEQISSQMKYY